MKVSFKEYLRGIRIRKKILEGAFSFLIQIAVPILLVKKMKNTLLRCSSVSLGIKYYGF